MKIIFEKGAPGRRGVKPPNVNTDTRHSLPKNLTRSESAELPEVSELEAVRHFTELSRRNFGVDTNFYPLGSCTMKYNPKINEAIARLPGFTDIHPLLPQLKDGSDLSQGALQALYETERLLSAVTGMAEFTLQPMAGAHGELTGIMMMAAYHRKKGNKKKRIIVPDSSHGTNPASAAVVGYSITSVPSDKNGTMDFDAFLEVLDDDVAGLMLTSPNTLGLFNPRIKEIADKLHAIDGLMYCDGANFNAILGKMKPADAGFDIIHLNLHKTFATPHGGGGPGTGPVGVVERLRNFLPVSRVVKKDDGSFALNYDAPDSIGFIAPFYGNFGVLLKAYAYMLMLGREGFERASEFAVLNANYVMAKLKHKYDLPYDKQCMHECVFSATRQAQKGVRAIDIAKRLMDFGFHPPTIYFPLIVKEALMIEPTETESKETLDAFIDAMLTIADEAENDPDKIKAAPTSTPVTRLDETAAARELRLTF
ncbi:MAG: aminomethyl-transferring glycine dehydrogenase subunit GcvPB [Lentisphaerae bacterium]|nr:aminomethyl-transferring glycine dehydrogenase subunit GcvPB [Lentisphaerota bacterium]